MNEHDDFKKLDKSLRKQQIIDTAIKLFHRMGYRAATLDHVASELGITRSALYHYVSSKEALLSEIFFQAVDRFHARGCEIGEADLSAREKLRAFVQHNLRQTIIENLAMFGVFFSEEAELPDNDVCRITEAKKEYTAVLEKILAQGMDEGLFRRTDPRLQAAAILGMCNWTCKWYKPGRDGQSPEEITDHFIAFMERGTLVVESKPVQKKHEKETLRMTDELKKEGEKLNNLISELQAVVRH